MSTLFWFIVLYTCWVQLAIVLKININFFLNYFVEKFSANVYCISQSDIFLFYPINCAKTETSAHMTKKTNLNHSFVN